MIGEPTFADAILDRIVHNAYRLALDGASIRKIRAAEEEKGLPMEDGTGGTSNAGPLPAKPAKGARK